MTRGLRIVLVTAGWSPPAGEGGGPDRIIGFAITLAVIWLGIVRLGIVWL